MKNAELKYMGASTVFQEVPDEVSLAIEISGCPHKCEGCHSPFLWEYEGRYLADDFDDLLEEYAEYITCICFMGGDQNPEELKIYFDKAHAKGLKVCLYTGDDSFPDVAKGIEYVKVGSYKKDLGGLNIPTTNQRMYKKEGNDYRDITKIFQRKLI